MNVFLIKLFYISRTNSYESPIYQYCKIFLSREQINAVAEPGKLLFSNAYEIIYFGLLI